MRQALRALGKFCRVIEARLRYLARGGARNPRL